MSYADEETKKEIANIEKYLHVIFNSTSELMVITDRHGKIKDWNKAAERLTGFRRLEMIGKDVFMERPSQLKNMMRMARESITRKASDFYEITVATKDNIKREFVTSTVILTDHKHEFNGLLISARPIVSQTDNLKENRGKSFIVTEQDKASILTMLNNTSNQRIFISRNDPCNIEKKFPDSQILWLSEKEHNTHQTAARKDQIIKWLSKRLNSSYCASVFLDRIDYLMNITSFKDVIKLIYDINDLIVNTKHTAFIHINTKTFEDRQIRLLYQELTQLPHEEHKVTKQQLEVLKFLNNQDIACIKVYFKDISKTFNMSKITTKRLLFNMVRAGLIKVSRTGRSKLIEVTAEGKILIGKSS